MPSPRLPAERDRFVGRERELGEVAELVAAGHRLVTLVGGPGIGKTRLAQRFAVAQARAAAFDGGVWFCDLSAARHPRDVAAAVARCLGIAPAAGAPEDPEEVVGDQLLGRGRALIVLDNFEQVIAAAPATLARWLTVAPEVCFLVTSRQRLGIAGEVCRDLGALSRADAIALFEARAWAARRPPALGDDDRALLGEIVDRLDRVPLAIELAASRVATLSLTELRDRLSDRLESLAAAHADAPPRHASLRAAIDWSWALLPEWAREAMRQCAVFQGGFSLAAAEAVVRLDAHADAPPVVDALRALVGHSLLTCDYPGGASAPARYGMFEAIRDYAGDALVTAAARAETEARHARFFLERGEALAERAGGTGAVDAVAELALEHGNLVAAHRRMCAGEPAVAARLALALLPVAIAHGSYLMYAESFDAAVEAAERAGDAPLEARARWARSARLRTGVGSAAAERDLARVLEIARAAGDRRLEASANIGLGAILFFLPDRLADVEGCWQAALTTYEAIADDSGAANALANLALLALERCDHAQAEPLARRALERVTAAGALHRRSFPLIVLAGVAQDRGDLDQARARYEEALRIAGELHAHRGHEAEALMHLGIVECEAARWGAARERLTAAIERYGDLAMPSEAGLAFAFLAAVEAMQGDRVAASRALDRARVLLRSLHARGTGELTAAIEGVLAAARAGEAAGSAADDAKRAFASLGDATLPHLARAARRVLGSELARLGGGVEASALPRLRVERDGRWFELDGGARVELGRRKLLRRMLAALVAHQRSSPRHPLPPAALIAACWPGESIRADSAANRLYVAISKLRKLGLHDVLRTGDDGYELAARVELAND